MSGIVSVPNLFAAATSGTTPQLDADFAALVAALNNPLTYATYTTDSGAVNAYVGTLSPAPANQAALLGVTVAFKANNSNTGASTLNLNALGAQAIVRPGGAALQAGDLLGTVIVVWDGTNYVLQTARASSTPNDYITGFSITNNGATGQDVAKGVASDSTNALTLTGTAIANKTQSAWAAGAAAGGKLSAAAMANNTWYYWYAIRKDSDGSVDYGFDVSSAAPTLPGGYTFWRYIGARKTQLAATNWDTFSQHGDEVYWSTIPALDVATSNPGTAAVTATLNVPAVKVKAIFHWELTDQDGAGVSVVAAYFSALENADIGPNLAATPLASASTQSQAVSSSLNGGTHPGVWTNTSSQIRYRLSLSNANINIRLVAIGWMDPRGKPV